MARAGRDEQKGCPHCFELISARARFCRHCGSDMETGWASEADRAESFAEEHHVFDAEGYEDYLRREGLGGRKKPALRVSPTALIALVVLLAFLLAMVLR